MKLSEPGRKLVPKKHMVLIQLQTSSLKRLEVKIVLNTVLYSGNTKNYSMPQRKTSPSYKRFYLQGKISLFKIQIKAIEKVGQRCKVFVPSVENQALYKARHALAEEKQIKDVPDENSLAVLHFSLQQSGVLILDYSPC